MKRIITFCLIVLLIVTQTAYASEFKLEDSQQRELFDFGIMIGDGNGNLRLNDYVTRAEFCKMICVAMGFQNSTDNNLTVVEDFYDVDMKHWAYPYIQIARGLKLMEGNENGYFSPDQSVSLREVVQIIVTALGYQPKALEENASDGYLMLSKEIGLLYNLETEWDISATREQASYLIAKSLDIPILQQTSFGSDNKYSVMNGENGVPLITFRVLRTEK